MGTKRPENLVTHILQTLYISIFCGLESQGEGGGVFIMHILILEFRVKCDLKIFKVEL